MPAPIILRTSCGAYRLAPNGHVTRLPARWLALRSGGTGRRYGADIAIRRTRQGRFILLRHGRVIWRSHELYYRTGDDVTFGPHLFAFNAYSRGVFVTDLRGPERMALRGRALYPIDFTSHGDLLVAVPGGAIAVVAPDGHLLRRYRYRQRDMFAEDGRAATLYFVTTDDRLAVAQGTHLRLLRRLTDVNGSIGFEQPGLLAFFARRSVAVTRLDGRLLAQVHWPRSRLDDFDSGLSISPDRRSFVFRLSSAGPGAKSGKAVLYVFHPGDSGARAIYRHQLGPSGCAVGAGMSWHGHDLLYSSTDGRRAIVDVRTGRRIDLTRLAQTLPHQSAADIADAFWEGDFGH